MNRAEKYLVPEKSSSSTHVIFKRTDPREYDPELFTD